MSNQQNIVKLIKAISGQANVLTIPKVYLDLLNNKHRAALLLSQCVYWSDKSKDPDGWFWKTDSAWKVELGLTRGGLDTALKDNEKYIETKIARVRPTPKRHYRVKLDLLVSDISDLLETDKSDLLENSESTIHRLYTEITEEGADAPAPKTKRATSPKPRAELMDHPAVKAYRDECLNTPNLEARRAISQAVTDCAKWIETLQAFKVNHWNTHNIVNLIDAYKNGSTGKRNGNGKNGHASPTDIQAQCDAFFQQNPKMLSHPEEIAYWVGQGATVKGVG